MKGKKGTTGVPSSDTAESFGVEDAPELGFS